MKLISIIIAQATVHWVVCYWRPNAFYTDRAYCMKMFLLEFVSMTRWYAPRGQECCPVPPGVCRPSTVTRLVMVNCTAPASLPQLLRIRGQVHFYPWFPLSLPSCQSTLPTNPPSSIHFPQPSERWHGPQHQKRTSQMPSKSSQMRTPSAVCHPEPGEHCASRKYQPCPGRCGSVRWSIVLCT